MKRALLVLGALSLGVSAFGVLEGPLEWPRQSAGPKLRFVYEFRGRLKPPARPWYIKVFRGLVGLSPEQSVRRRTKKMHLPTAIAAANGMLYIGDVGTRGILRYDPAEKKVEWLPQGGKLQLVSPVALAVHPDGRIFVADSDLGKIFILSPEGRPAGVFAEAGEHLTRPVGLALGEDRLFVSDVKRHRIAVFGLDGSFQYAIGKRGSANGEFNFPTYIHLDRKNERLFVVDSSNFRIQWFSKDGTHLGGFGRIGNKPGYLARPRGIALDSDDNIYLSDGAFESVQVFDLKGRLLYNLGREGKTPGRFNLPGGVTVDENDRLYVADTHNSRVQAFQYLRGGGL
jgi:sugar lactone lactonase YvrE